MKQHFLKMQKCQTHFILVIKIILLLLISVSLHAQSSISVTVKEYNVRLSNFVRYTKYVKMKYVNEKGNLVKKELKLSRNQNFDIKIYDKTFYLYSVSYDRNGKLRAGYGINGKDGIDYMRKHLKGKKVFFRKIDCKRQLRGVFKTVHLGV